MNPSSSLPAIAKKIMSNKDLQKITTTYSDIIEIEKLQQNKSNFKYEQKHIKYERNELMSLRHIINNWQSNNRINKLVLTNINYHNKTKYCNNKLEYCDKVLTTSYDVAFVLGNTKNVNNFLIFWNNINNSYIKKSIENNIYILNNRLVHVSLIDFLTNIKVTSETALILNAIYFANPSFFNDYLTDCALKDMSILMFLSHTKTNGDFVLTIPNEKSLKNQITDILYKQLYIREKELQLNVHNIGNCNAQIVIINEIF
jgi:hypothetical protein